MLFRSRSSVAQSVDTMHDRPWERARSADSEGFRLPHDQMKKLRQQDRRRHQVITGKARSAFGRFKGAPEPNRDLFIYRVDANTETDDLETYMRDKGFEVRDLCCISDPRAKFQSFKLTVPVSQFKDLFSDSPWPARVKVRKYIPPKNRELEVLP